MKKENIKIGIAGCGWIAEKAHIPAFVNLDGVKISSVFDVVIDYAEALASKYNIDGIYDNYEEFLKSGINAVVIATPNYTHAHYSTMALERGIHVLCEKPAALFTEEMLYALKVAERSGSLFMPGFVNRFRYDIRKIRDLVSNNEIGDILEIKSGWLRKAGIPRPGTWFTNRKYSGGGVLSDLGPHVIDICMMFFPNDLPSEVSLFTEYNTDVKESGAKWFDLGGEYSLPIDVEDTAIGSIKYKDGVSVNFELSWSVPIQGDCTYFTLIGTKGSIELKTLFGFSDDRLWKEDSMIINNNSLRSYKINLNSEFNHTRLAFLSMASYFISVIRGETRYTLNGQDALRNVKIIESLYMNENRTDINKKLRWSCF